MPTKERLAAEREKKKRDEVLEKIFTELPSYLEAQMMKQLKSTLLSAKYFINFLLMQLDA